MQCSVSWLSTRCSGDTNKRCNKLHKLVVENTLPVALASLFGNLCTASRDLCGDLSVGCGYQVPVPNALTFRGVVNHRMTRDGMSLRALAYFLSGRPSDDRMPSAALPWGAVSRWIVCIGRCSSLASKRWSDC
ncbi:hypothetical protein LIA77_04865 [Sarocladium implicatum]|nr:hypothetical protein LIA77_04865 [Sarocladium implicatum]